MPDNATTQSLKKIVVGFKHHWAEMDGESFWAQPLGGDRYELRNVPFYAYGLNFGDVVVAKAEPGDEFPIIERVERASGHRTYRFVPAEDVGTEALLAAIESLEALGVGVERANAKLMALDLAPEVDEDAVFDRLEELEGDGVLEFETCERQVEDDFGASPDEG